MCLREQSNDQQNTFETKTVKHWIIFIFLSLIYIYIYIYIYYELQNILLIYRHIKARFTNVF